MNTTITTTNSTGGEALHANCDIVKALRPIISRVRTDVCWVVKNGVPARIDKQLTDSCMVMHVSGGGVKYGTAPIHPGTSTTRIGLLDFDSHKGETSWSGMQAAALKVIEALEERGAKPIPFRSSGGKGVHVYLLWDAPQDAYSVRMFLKSTLESVGFKNGAAGVAAGEVEVFPKQNAVGEKSFGNMFVLPLAGESVPLEPLTGLDPLPKESITEMDWPESAPVPVLVREVPIRPVGAVSAAVSTLTSALAAIPNEGARELSYDEWRNVIFGIHHATDGSDDGLALAHTFSARSSKYDPEFLDMRVWPYIKTEHDSERGGITVRTILHMARDLGNWAEPGIDDFEVLPPANAQEEAEAAAVRERNKVPSYGEILAYMEYHSLVEESTVLGDAVTTMIARAKSELTAIQANQLVNALKDLTKGSVAAIREDIARKSKVRAVETHRPKWMEGWVFVTDTDRFFHLESKRIFTRFAFDIAFARHMPEDANGNRKKPHLAAAEDYDIELVDNITYMPMCGPVFEMLGRAWGNCYRPDLVPEAPDSLTAEDSAAIETVKEHLRCFLPDDRERRLFTSWLAHNVQCPGVKIRWSPYVCGVEGDGKTFFSRLLGAVLGTPNVKPVNASTIEASEFNEWAVGAAVIGIEEVKLQGHNRYDVANRLKPLIANDEVQIHPKGRSAYQAPNVTNYLLFSNHPDGMPVTDADRRYFFLRGAISTEKVVEITVAGYFKKLFDAAQKHQGALRSWLLEYDLDAEFDANGRAPDTDMKRAVIQMCKNEADEAFEALVDWSAEDRPRAVGVGPKVISSMHLTRHLRGGIGAAADTLKTTRVNTLISNAGYTQFEDRVKWRGEACRVWLRAVEAPKGTKEQKKDFVRRLLDETEREALAAGDEGFDLV